ncbi:pentapeptide repeat-containing protein [Marine Group I thaumarchaeote]|uniref:Pentapeptide repeat-containing protein n=1 Tax=Marine Group I thaumarchaeote TaxID=2511932 RepID=A0A7K4NN90_9ARCH|nr:pentapeptide repeat-containing protein [Marine Group I thaumarchaeote]
MKTSLVGIVIGLAVTGISVAMIFGIMTPQDNIPQAEKSVTETTTEASDYPDWLINNPSWVTAREFTNSAFDNFDIEYINEKLTPCTDCVVTTNSFGFRGSEFSIDKSDNTYRIFAVGGSTTHGATLVNDDETWPAYLQQKFNQIDLEVNVEVINVGIMAAITEQESKMIKDRLVDYEPNLIIMYDGWNDIQHLTVNETIQNWQSVCELGSEEGFETIIILQPLVGTGNRVLTVYEYQSLNAVNIEKLRLLAENLVQLNQHCIKTADFRGIFDYVQHPIFSDDGHTGPLGNQIIAENVFAISLPIVSAENSLSYETKTEFPVHYYTSNTNQFTIYAVGADFTGRNFDGLYLRNAIFDKANLSNVSFKDAKLSGASLASVNLAGTDISNIDFSNSNLAGTDLSKNDLSNTILRGTNLSYANLSGQDLSGKDFTGTILREADLSNANLGNFEFSGRDLTGTNLSGQDLSGKDLTGTILREADLSNANLGNFEFSGRDLTGTNLSGQDLSGKDLTGTILRKADLSNVNLGNFEFSGRDLTGTNLSGQDLSGKDLTGTILRKADLSNANLGNFEFSGRDLTGTNLSGQDLSGKDLTKTILSGADLTDTVLPDGTLSEKNFQSTLFNGVDLSGKDLSHSKFYYASFDNANLENANLAWTQFLQVDLTNIKHKSLAGADLTDASFSHANLSGINLSGAILAGTNFWKADLSGLDFTVASQIQGAMFIETDLSNSNFEGVDLSPKQMYFHVFKNKAYLNNLASQGWTNDVLERELFSNASVQFIISTEVRGNDLAVNFVFFNNFAHANLEDANFKNAKLLNTNFYSANLTNADLSGADLSNAYLQGATLDNANLRCVNHPICVSG